MQFTNAIKNNYEFRRLYNTGKSAATGHIVLYSRKNRKKESRLGITVGTKVGGAVVRNRVRRRLKEIYRLHEQEICRGFDIVIVARVKSPYATYKQLDADFVRLLDKLGLRAQ